MSTKSPSSVAPASATEIVVLLDRSGSMEAIRSDMIHGFAAFVRGQRELPGRCLVTLVQFDSHAIETVYEARPIADVPELVLQPRGTTPLLDAMGDTIGRAHRRLSALAAADRPERVLFVVMTDGHENASHEFRRDQVKQIVERRQAEDKWAFTFLGANIDAFDEGASLGVDRAAAMPYVADRRGVQMAFLDLSDAAKRYRQGGDYRIESSDPRTKKDREE